MILCKGEVGIIEPDSSLPGSRPTRQSDQLVGERDSGFVVVSALFDVEHPALQP
jgi:hypothetical protein